MRDWADPSLMQIISLPPPPQNPVLLATLRHNTPDHKDYSINCVSWAPMAGRSYHLIATGGRDTYVRVWRVFPKSNTNPQPAATTTSGEETSLEWEVRQVGEFEDHK